MWSPWITVLKPVRAVTIFSRVLRRQVFTSSMSTFIQQKGKLYKSYTWKTMKRMQVHIYFGGYLLRSPFKKNGIATKASIPSPNARQCRSASTTRIHSSNRQHQNKITYVLSNLFHVCSISAMPVKKNYDLTLWEYSPISWPPKMYTLLPLAVENPTKIMTWKIMCSLFGFHPMRIIFRKIGCAQRERTILCIVIALALRLCASE